MCVHIYIYCIYMCVPYIYIYIYYRISHSRSSHVRYPPPSGSQASHSQIPPGRSAERRSGRCPADVSAVKHSEWKSLNPPKMGWNVVKPRKICKNPDWTKLGHKKWSVESTINGDLNDLSRNKWGFNAQSMEFYPIWVCPKRMRGILYLTAISWGKWWSAIQYRIFWGSLFSDKPTWSSSRTVFGRWLVSCNLPLFCSLLVS